LHTKITFIKSLEGNLSEGPRRFYRFIKARRTDSHGIPALKTANGTVSIDADKANSLNDYFASVFTVENKSTIPVTKRLYLRRRKGTSQGYVYGSRSIARWR